MKLNVLSFLKKRKKKPVPIPKLRALQIFKEESFEVPLFLDIYSESHSSIISYIQKVPAYNVYTLTNGKCIVGDEKVFTSKNKCLDQISSQPIVHISRKQKLSLLFFRKIYGRILTISLSGLEDNYYHFNVEFLGRYFVFLSSGLEYDWIIFPRRKTFHKEFISLLRIDENKILDVPEGSAIMADELIFTDLINNWKVYEYKKGYKSYVKQYCPSWILGMYKTVIRNRIEIKDNLNIKSFERIYISRQKAKYRHVINEIELINLLDKYNFKVVHLEDLSVIQQIDIFRWAQIVVAPHGAGLVNISYTENQITVLELFSENYHDPGFRIQSLILNHDYHFYIGKKINKDDIPPQQEDILVDIAIIEEWLQKNILR